MDASPILPPAATANGRIRFILGGSLAGRILAGYSSFAVIGACALPRKCARRDPITSALQTRCAYLGSCRGDEGASGPALADLQSSAVLVLREPVGHLTQGNRPRGAAASSGIKRLLERPGESRKWRARSSPARRALSKLAAEERPETSKSRDGTRSGLCFRCRDARIA
jgi:hypothetical protein